MKILEYEAKKILGLHSIAVPDSYIVTNGSEPGFLPAVIKSQVPIGGRGKAGGIKVVTTATEFQQATKHIRTLPIKGFVPTTLLAETLIDIDRELYLSLLINKQHASIVLMAHRSGGIEVEDNKAEDFLRVTVDGKNSIQAGEKLAEYFDLPDQTFVLQDLVTNLYDCFIKNDVELLEINPLIYTTDHHLVAGDCKMILDDAASFRHPEWQFEAEKTEANFVTLNEQGTVATIANGAGLAMATVDAVVDAGLVPANFLDIGGGANEASVLAAFQKIMEYPNIQVIIINIFAGITRCDEIANAIIAAKSHIPDLPPLYIRLAGTNFEKAVQLLADQNIPTLATLADCVTAAQKDSV